MTSLRPWAYYSYKTGLQRTIELRVANIPVRIMWTPRFDKRGEGTRAVLSASFDTSKFHYGLLLQHYRQGYDFDEHFDGVKENIVISFLLHRSKEGGEFFIHGPQKSWFSGRVKMFDGGKYLHGVTKILKGSRTVLMLQRGIY